MVLASRHFSFRVIGLGAVPGPAWKDLGHATGCFIIALDTASDQPGNRAVRRDCGSKPAGCRRLINFRE
jgi:hypothetical protein